MDDQLHLHPQNAAERSGARPAEVAFCWSRHRRMTPEALRDA